MQFNVHKFGACLIRMDDFKVLGKRFSQKLIIHAETFQSLKILFKNTFC